MILRILFCACVVSLGIGTTLTTAGLLLAHLLPPSTGAFGTVLIGASVTLLGLLGLLAELWDIRQGEAHD